MQLRIYALALDFKERREKTFAYLLYGGISAAGASIQSKYCMEDFNTGVPSMIVML